MQITKLQDAIDMLKALTPEARQEFFGGFIDSSSEPVQNIEIMDEDITWTLSVELQRIRNRSGEYFYFLSDAYFKLDTSQTFEIADKKQLAQIWGIIPEVKCDYVDDPRDDYETYLQTTDERI